MRDGALSRKLLFFRRVDSAFECACVHEAILQERHRKVDQKARILCPCDQDSCRLDITDASGGSLVAFRMCRIHHAAGGSYVNTLSERLLCKAVGHHAPIHPHGGNVIYRISHCVFLFDIAKAHPHFADKSKANQTQGGTPYSPSNFHLMHDRRTDAADILKPLRISIACLKSSILQPRFVHSLTSFLKREE